ncbi:myeloid cell surface antigen CD33-like [Phyllostomus hastatus]|uniref:myeloid cell surface antigen CD33-like n=1 Tax=Phyllostomus hastatus TaxID=9423 RepID=UPI001E6859C5|nr:myeloid cell surface antigen CD33-like [Phyllostomus hastatus]
MLLLLLLLALLWAGSRAEDPRFQLQVQGSLMVQEGQCIFMPCTVIYPKIGWTETAPTRGYWFPEGTKSGKDVPVATNIPNCKVRNETRGQFILVGDPWTYNCSLNMRDTEKRDNGRYFFRVKRGSCVSYYYRNNMLSVHVTVHTPTPDIHIQGTLESGHSNNITCTVSWACDRETSPMFSWMGANLTPLGPRTPNSSVLTLTPGPQHHGTNLTCQVAFPGGEISGGEIRVRTIQINVTCEYPVRTLEPQQLQGPSCSWEDEGLHSSCSSRVQLGPSLHWWPRERMLVGNHSNASHTVTFHSVEPWANSSLSIRGELTSNLRRGCEAQNAYWKETVTVLLLPGQVLRICRKKWAEKAESQEGISQGHLSAPSSHYLPPAPATSPSEHELHYAALSFHNMKPHKPQAQETPYSEVKFWK